MNLIMIKKFTLDYALTYLTYSQECPVGISQGAQLNVNSNAKIDYIRHRPTN
jgi:hypothetical protein